MTQRDDSVIEIDRRTLDQLIAQAWQVSGWLAAGDRHHRAESEALIAVLQPVSDQAGWRGWWA
jgi:hypothetical protein